FYIDFNILVLGLDWIEARSYINWLARLCRNRLFHAGWATMVDGCEICKKVRDITYPGRRGSAASGSNTC
ncbi:unnamed protein product, partial [Musa acuminata var. zebrina]